MFPHSVAKQKGTKITNYGLRVLFTWLLFMYSEIRQGKGTKILKLLCRNIE